MPKPDLNTVPEFYHKYIQRVDEEDVKNALLTNWEETLSFLQDIAAEQWNRRYAEGKWSIKEMIQHLIDSERVFAYRAMCISRGEKTSLPGFDENSYAALSEGDKRSKEDLLQEFTIARQSTILLFASFSVDQLNRTGIANNKPISVNSIGYITAGHVHHHLAIIKERYL